jgi:hypothetical protein
MRVSELIGRTVHAPDGFTGRVADVEVDGTAVVALIVVRGPWGRLLGYERDTVRGPWLLETLARAVLRRHSRRVAWSDARFGP